MTYNIKYDKIKTMSNVIFDLDGTLLNTLDDLMDSVNYALTELGFDKRNYSEIRSFVGNGVKLLVQRALPENGKDKLEQCLEIFSKHYDKNKFNKTRPYDGIIEMLKEVKAAGHKTAIVSNKYQSAVSDLAQNEFKGYIDCAIGERAGVSPKSAPDGVYIALKELNADKKDTVYVGDSDVDVMTAKNAGLKMIGVTWGFRDRELLIQCGADVIIDSPSEILKSIKSITENL